MKYTIALIICLAFAEVCVAQFDKQVTVAASLRLNIALEGLALNDAGIGLGLDASFFSKKKLQLFVEANGDRFIGDKLLIMDPLTGEAAKNAAVYSLRFGPRYFFTKRLAVAVTYGPAWHVVRDFEYSVDHSLNYSITGFWGKRRKFTTKLFLAQVLTRERNIGYLGSGVGLRF